MKITRTHRGIYGFIRQGDKVLLIVKKRGPYTGMYDLPGGSPEPGESEEETLKREIQEETGCTPLDYSGRQEQTVIFTNYAEKNGRPGCLQHTGILYRCHIEGKPDETISDLDSDGALWIKIDDLTPQNTTPLTFVCLDMYKDSINFPK